MSGVAEKKCENCEYWQGGQDTDSKKYGQNDLVIGWCRRYPPTRGSRWFPEVLNNQWCGEFKAVTSIDEKSFPFDRQEK